MKKKINSEHLWNYINELSRNEKVKFKVYCDDSYVTNIVWNGENFEWESGTFTSEAFFNPLYDFEVIEEDKKIEKLNIEYNAKIRNERYIEKGDNKIISLTVPDYELAIKINELIDVVNELKEKSE